MLRICYSENESVQRWLVCGQLAGPWVQELRSCWEQALRHTGRRANRALVVDVTDVTFIDQSGETLLADMRTAGAEFIVAGVETKYLIDNLKTKTEAVAAGQERTSGAALRGEPPGASRVIEHYQAKTKANGRPRRHK